MSVFILRHGQTAWNAEFRLQGQRDIPLNPLGRQQAAGNGVALARLAGDLSGHHFVSSPLGRARETMEIARAAAGLDRESYSLDNRLIEICFGEWEGRTNDEVAAASPDLVAAREADKWDFVPPGDRAESYEILSWRVGAWLAEIDRPTVAVCHGGVIRCLFKLTGMLDALEAARMSVPQDRLLIYEGGRLEWV